MEKTTDTRDPSPHHQHGEGLNFRHYWHVVLERRWLVITAFVSVFALALLYLFQATPIFLAHTRLEIDRLGGGLLNLQNQTVSISTRDSDYLMTQYENLVSHRLIQKVIDNLNLHQDERYAHEEDILQEVIDDIRIVPKRLTRLVDIQVQHHNPERAAEIANTLTELFLDDNLAKKKSKSWNSFLFLQNEVEVLEDAVQSADLDLHKFRLSYNLVSLEESQNIIAQALRQAQKFYDDAQKETSDLSRIAQNVEQSLISGVDVETIPYVADSSLVSQLRSRLLADEAEMARLRERYLEKYPLVIELNKRIETMRESVRTEAQKVIAGLRQRVDIAREKEKAALEHLDSIKADQHELSKKKVDYDILERKSFRNKFLYETMLAKAKEMDLSSKESMQNIRVEWEAKVPLEPFKPNIVLVLLLGVTGGLAIGIGLAFFVNFLDDSVKSQDDIETYLHLDFLGYVPNIRSNNFIERCLQSHVHPQSNSSEGFRTIRAALSLTHSEDALRCTAVTSTIPSEGKTLFACNLAIVKAQTGLRTILVDADLRRPSLHKAFQLQSPVGLTQCLMGKVGSVAEIIHSTSIPNLDVLCCGTVPSSPSELLNPDNLKIFLQELRKKYDRIILDCPPVSAVSDPLMIASVSDGTIFVTKFNKIRREHARRTVQRIHDTGVKIVGAVINDIDFEGKDSYYYSYYYYQNRYYASYYQKKKKEQPKEIQKAKG